MRVLPSQSVHMGTAIVVLVWGKQLLCKAEAVNVVDEAHVDKQWAVIKLSTGCKSDREMRRPPKLD